MERRGKSRSSSTGPGAADHRFADRDQGETHCAGGAGRSTAWRHATVVFVSDDEGRTRRRSNVLNIGQGRHDHAGSIEGTVIERRDGSLYQLLRTETGWLYEAVSRDGGLFWEAFRQSDIKSVTCCAVARLADGRIALLWNHPPRHRPSSGSSREEAVHRLLIGRVRDGRRRRSSRPTMGPVAGSPILIFTSEGPASRGSRRCRAASHERQRDRLARGEIPIYQPPETPPPQPGGIVMFGDSTTAERHGTVETVYAHA